MFEFTTDHPKETFLLIAMGCRDVHAATVLAFLSGTAALSGLIAAALLPNWRQMRLYTFNKNEKNVTVYTGLWIKCVRSDGSKDCVIYDTEWYTAVDQLDLRVLQLALPISMLTTVLALFLCLIGMCNTAFVSTVPNIKQTEQERTHCGLVGGGERSYSPGGMGFAHEVKIRLRESGNKFSLNSMGAGGRRSAWVIGFEWVN
ncbi:claudin-12 [Crotalus adamanteus]|uniref:Claudin-12 n=1 Tax=Crotalus adamanteus TaxID=8729 RepID=A0AAW1B2E7_CROAD